MVKNVKGGKYAKKQKNKGLVRERAEQPEPEEGQNWAMVMKMLGHCRIMLMMPSGEQQMGVIRGSMRKRVYIRPGDIVLITERDTTEERCDVVFKYDEAYIAALRKEEPKLPFWKAFYQLHAGGCDDEGDEDELVNFVEGPDEQATEDDEEEDSSASEAEEEPEDADAESDIDIDAI